VEGKRVFPSKCKGEPDDLGELAFSVALLYSIL